MKEFGIVLKEFLKFLIVLGEHSKVTCLGQLLWGDTTRMSQYYHGNDGAINMIWQNRIQISLTSGDFMNVATIIHACILFTKDAV